VIESITKDRVAVLAMRHGKANALDTELCQALCGALDEAAAGAAAVVLTGAGPVFSAGVDLKRVTAGREGYVAAFLPELRRAFTRLATFELPVVAAVNGHAIAGGFILFAAADWAVMAEGPGRAGVTELLVGVPFPAVALELLRLRAGDAQARPLALSGPPSAPARHWPAAWSTRPCPRRTWPAARWPPPSGWPPWARRSASPSASYGSGSWPAFMTWPSSTPRSMRSGRPRPPWNASGPS
jgi:Enoyl-CoA hydratase/isomerase